MTKPPQDNNANETPVPTRVPRNKTREQLDETTKQQLIDDIKELKRRVEEFTKYFENAIPAILADEHPLQRYESFLHDAQKHYDLTVKKETLRALKQLPTLKKKSPEGLRKEAQPKKKTRTGDRKSAR
jgi:hypothetical protein